MIWPAFRVRWPLGRVRVVGGSMTPTYPEDSWLLVRWFARPPAQPGIGTVVVARRPDRPHLLIVKRVRGVARGGAWLEGDNAQASDDSRLFGLVPSELLVGRVICCYRRPRSRA